MNKNKENVVHTQSTWLIMLSVYVLFIHYKGDSEYLSLNVCRAQKNTFWYWNLARTVIGTSLYVIDRLARIPRSTFYSQRITSSFSSPHKSPLCASFNLENLVSLNQDLQYYEKSKSSYSPHIPDSKLSCIITHRWT